tara:strand:- start:1621 stop:2085 length:465 start_codon:yes stop_codon:yes gene_type:complete
MNYLGYTVYPCGQIRGKESRGKESIMLKHIIDRNGYHRVSIHNKGVRENMFVHRLVAICFLSNPENKPTVNHNDDNPHNNDLTNLDWMTMKEQNDHKTKMRADNTSGTTGVSYDKRSNQWLVRLMSYGKRYCKYFKTKDEAIDYRKYLEETYKK